MDNQPTPVEPRENPAAPAKVRKLDRENMALDLRRQGASYRRIARQLRKTAGISESYSEGAAYKDVRDALKRLLDQQSELAAENLRMDLERLDEMFAKFWPRVVPPGGDQRPPDIMAGQFILAILDKRERLLNYKSLYAEPKQPPALNIDVTKLPTEALQRIRNGEDPISVLASLGGSGN